MNPRRAGFAIVVGLSVLASAPTAPADQASPEIRVQLLDGDGNGLPGAEGELRNGEQRFAFRSNDLGEARLSVPNGNYDVEVRFRGETFVTGRIAATEAQTLQYTLPVHRFRMLVSASNGDLLEGARAAVVDVNDKRAEMAVVNGRIEGIARAGQIRVELTWNAQTIDLATFSLPQQRSPEVEIPVVALDVSVVQKDTGLGFGPALVAAATPGNEFPAGEWSTPQGQARLSLFPGDTRVRATWFGVVAEAQARAPGAATIQLPLATKTIPGPENGPRAPYLAQLRQPQFQVWANGDPIKGIRLPLPEGKFDVTLFDDARKPIFRGIATVPADRPVADIVWQETAGGLPGDLAERRLQWPKGIWAQAPSAAVQESEDWRPVIVNDAGSIGLLPAGTHIRVPDHELGKIYETVGATLDVELGVIEIALQKAERVKLMSAERPDRYVVENCATARCRVALPPGRYLVYAPSAALLHDPVDVAHGRVAYVNTKSR